MGELVREAMTSDLPLCPKSAGPGMAPEHRMDVWFQDRLYEAMKPYRSQDEDEELPPDLDKVYSTIAYNEGYSRMLLHTESTQFLYHGTFMRVESWFYRCHLCGFVLPATAQDVTPRGR